MTDTTIATIGDNLPPDDVDNLRDLMAEKHADIEARKNELLDRLGHVPVTIQDEETAGKVADFIKQITGCWKNADGTRIKEKEPYLKHGRTVDGYFKSIMEPLAKAKKEIEQRLTLYQREVMLAERRIREEAQRKADEAARLAAEEAAKAAAAIREEADLGRAIEAEERAKQAQADAI